MQDLDIYNFLKYEESQGRKHPYIERTWTQAREAKRMHREAMHELTTLPTIKGYQEKEDWTIKAESYALLSMRSYDHLREKIEEELCAS